MQANAETASKAVAEAESALRTVTDTKYPDYAGFEPILERFRWTTQDYYFASFPEPVAKTAEDRLWEGHIKVHKKFQKHLKQFRDGPGRKKHVERRKAEKHYLAFIKASMQFYRGFIGRLASHFQNVPEVRAIAHKLHLDTLSVDVPVEVKSADKQLVVSSCYASLMRLGDLSRYRETDLQLKERNWGPAKGHYQLAISLHPGSGAAFNQLAVMALADEDHLRAVYYLHRAAAADKPFPLAPGNLKLEFEKILKMKPQEAAAISDMSKDTLNVLENRFLEFHANCHTRPTEYLTYQEKSSQIRQLIQVGFEEIQDRSLDKTMQKMCLINIAAEHLAWRYTSEKSLLAVGIAPAKVTEEHQRNCQAFYLLQRFNIETFLALLKTLARELDSTLVEGSDPPQIEARARAAVAVNRLLPHLRQYSSWLLTNIKAILEPRHASTRKCAEKFWKAYIQGLNMILKAYEVRTIPEVQHLLEEDEDTLAFAPFSEKVSLWRYKAEDQMLKCAFDSTPQQDRPMEDETRFRARELIVDALRLSNAKDDLGITWSPIVLGNTRFEYNEQVPAPPPEPAKTPSQPFRIRAHNHFKSASETTVDAIRLNFEHVDGTSEKEPSLQPAVELAMENMVDDLVSPSKPITSQRLSPSFNSSSIVTGTPRPTSGAISVTDLVGRMMQRPASSGSPHEMARNGTGNSSLTGIFPSPFTPRPEEKASLSPRLASAFPTRSPTMSARQFHQDLLQQEQEIQARTSPLQQHAFTSPKFSQSPYGLTGFVPPGASLSDVWGSPASRSPSQQSRQLPQTALFGAIGEPRRSGSRTPMSGRSG